MTTYASQIQRIISDMEVWCLMGTAGTEFTVTYQYPDAPDEVQHLRLARVRTGVWELQTLDAPHGSAIDHVTIHPDVVRRIRQVPGTFAGSAPTRKFISEFYGNENITFANY